jgi:hypothetical protein
MGTGQVQFIVANCGAKLNWIPMQERFEFWKAIRPQVADALRPIYIERFPNQTAYIASEWARTHRRMFDFVRNASSIQVGPGTQVTGYATCQAVVIDCDFDALIQASSTLSDAD